MLKHKVYHVTTYNVDDTPLSQDGGEESNSYETSNVSIKVSGSSYASYSSGGSYTGAYSASISGNYSSSELGSEEPAPSSSPYDDAGIAMRRSVTGGSTSGHVEKKNWNAEFQLLMEQSDSETKFKKLRYTVYKGKKEEV
jgi:hypothetical protein